MKTSRYCGISHSLLAKVSHDERKIEARRPNIVFTDKKEREVVITDVVIPGDDRVKDKELEKLEKYQLLKDEIAKVWRMRKVIIVSVYRGPWSRISQL